MRSWGIAPGQSTTRSTSAEASLFPEVHPANALMGNMPRLELLSRYGLNRNTVQLGKTGTDTNFQLLEIGCLSQRFAVLTEQRWVEPADSGIHAVRNIPDVHLADSALEWLEGRVPVPGGAIVLSWRKQGDKLVYRLDALAGYTITLHNRSSRQLALARQRPYSANLRLRVSCSRPVGTVRGW
jgi:hypothetical protein